MRASAAHCIMAQDFGHDAALQRGGQGPLWSGSMDCRGKGSAWHSARQCSPGKRLACCSAGGERGSTDSQHTGGHSAGRGVVALRVDVALQTGREEAAQTTRGRHCSAQPVGILIPSCSSSLPSDTRGTKEGQHMFVPAAGPTCLPEALPLCRQAEIMWPCSQEKMLCYMQTNV